LSTTGDRRLFSPAHAADRARTGRRLLAAGVAAVLIIIVIAFLGPSKESVEKRFTPYGAEGPLQIMPEISIEEGQDERHQRARTAQQTPPAPTYEVEPQDDPRAEETVAERREDLEVAADATEPDPQAEVTVESVFDGTGTVELTLPRQTADQAFVIRKMQRPLYPPGATEEERRRPEIRIDVALFVQSSGEVTATMITHSDGGAVFEQAVLDAVARWEFEPVRRPDGSLPAARWLEMSWRFRSPYILDGDGSG